MSYGLNILLCDAFTNQDHHDKIKYGDLESTLLLTMLCIETDCVSHSFVCRMWVLILDHL